MKFTLSWLKEYLETDASLDEIGSTLTSVGLELESIDDPSKIYAPFRTAFVVSAEKHPDADRLKVCVVDTGREKVRVVCGAPNAKAGMIGVFAPEGSYIPGLDTVLKKGVIRGVESCGMLVSEREMALSDSHEGIIELDPATRVGVPFAEVMGLCDPVIDVSITPNRADCTGVYGIARDLAAAGIGRLKPLNTSPVRGGFKSPVSVSIQTDNNPLFLGRYIKGVRNGDSPEWMQRRLKAVGLRPISALVDITNYMSVGMARPLHVFDADKLIGNIHVRLSKEGERLEALNDKTYELGEGHTVVCDDSGPLGLGGVIGGVSTGAEADTVNVFVEAAYFQPMAIAKTGRTLQIDSDARYRFERGIDPEFTHAGMEIATRLILEICGGEASEVVKAGDTPHWQRMIEYDPDYCLKLGGVDVSRKDQQRILEDLGFIVTVDSEPWVVQPPSWRGDVEGRADIVEEILRISGYDNLPAISVHNQEAITRVAETRLGRLARISRAELSGRGLEECITWAFMQTSLAMLFGVEEGENKRQLTLCNPINSELDIMRPSPLPNLIAAVQRNSDRGYPDVALFEVGPGFLDSSISGQVLIAAGVRAGNAGPRHWSGPHASRLVNAFDARADATAVLEACGVPVENLQVGRNAPDWYHPGRSGTLSLGKNVLARFGEIHPAVLAEMGIKGQAVAFEVFPELVPEGRAKGTAKAKLDLSPFQPVNRDFAFIVASGIDADSIVRAAKGADRRLIRDVQVFDVYTGKGMEEGKKSVAINVIIQPKEKTLTEAELESISQKIIDAVAVKTGGVLRG